MLSISALNENTVMVYFSESVSPETAQNIAVVVPQIEVELAQFVVDMVPSYTSLLITFDLFAIRMDDFCTLLETLLANIDWHQTKSDQSSCIELPVYYGPEVALDAEAVSRHTGLAFSDVVKLHTECSYRVYAIGFAPGFAYLGNTNKRIATPRMSTPRSYVPAGSVAIADRQTAVYPKASPGGWHILGRTPVNLIDYHRENLTLFEMGAQVLFSPIDKQTFLQMGGVLSQEELQRTEEAI
ncbi:5-oxoprolinase subunit PxpB [Vibrio profundum]|uniref:5-oxoprolinase subunit PxpB n=1 Tax=Vibrio profundum TaxID=2910247 RepID=UPI003D0BA7F1